jgi:hypothetical protein
LKNRETVAERVIWQSKIKQLREEKQLLQLQCLVKLSDAKDLRNENKS